MTFYVESSGTYTPVQGTNIEPIQSLPVGTYVLKSEMFKGFFLEKVQDFTVPTRVYGEARERAERILNTYRQRGKNTGVMFSGEKGSGKSMLSKLICTLSGLPVIIINSSFTGDGFNSFLGLIDQPCIVLFDEFEKVYELKEQKQILTLLDGTFNSNKLFILTCNNKWGIDDCFMNRPGRIYYFIEFKGIDEKFIREYCDENLLYEEFYEGIYRLSKICTPFNFDLLACLVEEVNRYKEPPKDLSKILNVKPDHGADTDYSGVAQYKDQTSKRFRVSDFNPFSETCNYVLRLWYKDSSFQDSDVLEGLNAEEIEAYLEDGTVFFFAPEAKSIGGRMRVDDSGDYFRYRDVHIQLDPAQAVFDMKTNKITYWLTESIRVVLSQASSVDAYFREY